MKDSRAKNQESRIKNQDKKASKLMSFKLLCQIS